MWRLLFYITVYQSAASLPTATQSTYGAGPEDEDCSAWDSLPKLEINGEAMNWLEVLDGGWAHPLKGFMREKEYLQVLHFEHLIVDNTYIPFPVPIVLAAPTKLRDEVGTKKQITLMYQGEKVALLENVEFFEHRKEERTARTFGMMEKTHPYAAEFIYPVGDLLVGGDVRLKKPIVHDDFKEYRMTPAQLQEEWKRRGADAVFCFQVRNPIHNGHALLMKMTYESLKKQGYKKPVLWISPLGGWTKDDDVPLRVRMEQHAAIIKNGVFGDVEVILGIFPSPMLYAGPREVQWHARARQIAGATHYIVGRDPAGMKHPSTKEDLYAMWDGQHMLQSNPSLNLTLVPFQFASYDKKAGAMAIFDPARKDDFISVSGTKMRSMARTGETPPDGFMDPQGWEVLRRFYKQKNEL